MADDSQLEMGRRVFMRHAGFVPVLRFGHSGFLRMPMLESIQGRWAHSRLLPDTWSAPVFTWWPLQRAASDAWPERSQVTNNSATQGVVVQKISGRVSRSEESVGDPASSINSGQTLPAATSGDVVARESTPPLAKSQAPLGPPGTNAPGSSQSIARALDSVALPRSAPIHAAETIAKDLTTQHASKPGITLAAAPAQAVSLRAQEGGQSFPRSAAEHLSSPSRSVGGRAIVQRRFGAADSPSGSSAPETSRAQATRVERSGKQVVPNSQPNAGQSSETPMNSRPLESTDKSAVVPKPESEGAPQVETVHVEKKSVSVPDASGAVTPNQEHQQSRQRKGDATSVERPHTSRPTEPLANQISPASHLSQDGYTPVTQEISSSPTHETSIHLARPSGIGPSGVPGASEEPPSGVRIPHATPAEAHVVHRMVPPEAARSARDGSASIAHAPLGKDASTELPLSHPRKSAAVSESGAVQTLDATAVQRIHAELPPLQRQTGPELIQQLRGSTGDIAKATPVREADTQAHRETSPEAPHPIGLRTAPELLQPLRGSAGEIAKANPVREADTHAHRETSPEAQHRISVQTAHITNVPLVQSAFAEPWLHRQTLPIQQLPLGTEGPTMSPPISHPVHRDADLQHLEKPPGAIGSSHASVVEILDKTGANAGISANTPLVHTDAAGPLLSRAASPETVPTTYDRKVDALVRSGRDTINPKNPTSLPESASDQSLQIKASEETNPSINGRSINPPGSGGAAEVSGLSPHPEPVHLSLPSVSEPISIAGRSIVPSANEPLIQRQASPETALAASPNAETRGYVPQTVDSQPPDNEASPLRRKISYAASGSGNSAGESTRTSSNVLGTKHLNLANPVLLRARQAEPPLLPRTVFAEPAPPAGIDMSPVRAGDQAAPGGASSLSEIVRVATPPDAAIVSGPSSVVGNSVVCSTNLGPGSVPASLEQTHTNAPAMTLHQSSGKAPLQRAVVSSLAHRSNGSALAARPFLLNPDVSQSGAVPFVQRYASVEQTRADRSALNNRFEHRESVSAVHRFADSFPTDGNAALQRAAEPQTAAAGALPSGAVPPLYSASAQQGMSDFEVKQLADRVYNMLVRRLSSEKDRRGISDAV